MGVKSENVNSRNQNPASPTSQGSQKSASDFKYAHAEKDADRKAPNSRDHIKKSRAWNLSHQFSSSNFSSLVLQEPPATKSDSRKPKDLNYHPFKGNSHSTYAFNPSQHYSSVVKIKPRQKNFWATKFNEITFDFIDPQRHTKFYRHDIDGLRGFACLLVAIFHIWVRRTSGGVDVFLTISGFFFLPSLLRKICKPGFHVKDFSPFSNIKNILRRLWPAMVVVLFAIFLLGWQLLPHESRLDMLKQIRASFVFYENWYMYNNGRSYLTASSDVSPLQHMWSMAIQGQFFLATILIILIGGYLVRLIVKKTGRNDAKAALWVMLALAMFLTLASFIYATYIMQVDPSGGYYDTFARIWEPLAGGLIGIFCSSIVLPRLTREIMSLVSIVLITVIGLIIWGTIEFPGPWALVPVLSALAIIVVYNPRHDPKSMPIVNQILSGKFFQWFGKISYPLYLWHWPLLIMFLDWRPYINQPSFIQGTLLILISIALAWLTATFVENPIRSSKKLPFSLKPTVLPAPKGLIIQGALAKFLYYCDRIYKPAAILVLAIFLVIMGSAYKHWNQWLKDASTTVSTPISLYPGAEAFLNNAPVPPGEPIQPALEVARYGDLPPTTRDGCINDFNSPATPIVCDKYGDTSAKKFIILSGGSHAEHWIAALDEIGKKYHFKIVTILRMGCELSSNPNPVKPTPNGNVPYPECAGWEKAAIDKIIEMKPAFLFTTVTRPNPTPDVTGDWTPGDYIDAFKQLSDAGIEILGMRDTPWPHATYKGKRVPPSECIESLGTNDAAYYQCGVKYSDALNAENPAKMALEDFHNIHLLDMTRGICNFQRNYCPAVIGNVLVWHDDHHLSSIFVKTLEDELIKQMGAVMGFEHDTPKQVKK